MWNAVLTMLPLLLAFVLGGASTLAILLFAAVIIEDDEKQKRATRKAVAVTVHRNNESSKTGIASDRAGISPAVEATQKNETLH
jgi:hypothetical protein